MKPDTKILELHQTYCHLSGMDVALRFNRESSWVDFTRAGFTKADLEAVIQRLLRLIKQGERRPESLKFSNVVEGLDRFEEELAMINAEAKGLLPVERPMSVMELQRIKEAKQALLDEFKAVHANEDAFGLNWDSPDASSRARAMRQQIHTITEQISQMA
jgi:hypothetical protein